MQTKSLKLNAFLNIFKTLMGLIFPLITFPYSSRVLMPENIGKVNFANSIISYFGIIASLGIGTYAIREGSKVRDDKERLSCFVKEILIINLISTLVAYILLFISLLIIPKFQEYKTLLIIISSNLILTTVGINWLYSAVEEYTYTTARSLIFQIISILALFVFVKVPEDYLKYAAISVISSVGSNICNIIHARKFITLKTKSKLELKKHLKPIFILFASSIAISVFTMLDTSMLGFLSTNEEIGYYSTASKITRMIRDLFPAVFTVLFARLSYYKGTGDKTKFIDLTQKTFLFIFCFSLPIVSGIYILSEPLIMIFCGANYVSAIPSTKILSFLIFFSSCSGFLGGQLMLAMGKDLTYLICMIGAAITDIILNFIFIPKFGASGASFATLITEILIFITYAIIMRDVLKQIKIKKQFFQFFISSIIMTICVFFTSKLFTNNWLKLFIPILVGIIVYAFMLFILKNDFFLNIVNVLKKKLKLKLNHKEKI